ncbi:hypothetical protein TorRG33x02_358430, partial [Trema orientale]
RRVSSSQLAAHSVQVEGNKNTRRGVPGLLGNGIKRWDFANTFRFKINPKSGELHASACLASVPSGFAREKDLLFPFVRDDGLGGERTEPTCLFKRITTLRGIVSVRRVRPSQYHVCVQELTIRAPY